MNFIVQATVIYLCIIRFNNDITNLKGAEAVAGPLTLLAIALGSYWFFGLFTKKKDRNAVNLFTLFMISFLIVNFQAYIDMVLGFVDVENKFIWKGWRSVHSSAYLSVAALSSFLLGYKGIRKKEEKRSTTRRLPSISLIAKINGVAFLGFIIFVNKAYIFGGYGKEDLGFLGGNFALLFESSIVSFLAVSAFRNMKRGGKDILNYFLEVKWVLIFSLIYLFLVVISGDRGPLIFIGLSFLLHFILVTNKKVSYILLLGGLFLGLTFLSILGQTRQAKGADFSERLSSRKANYYDAYPESFSMGTKELAGSIRVNHIAVDYFPDRFPHAYGFLTLQELLLIIPGLKGAFIDGFGVPKYLTSSAQFITFISLGPNATWGVGTACVADVFINFGLYGVVIGFILFGILARKFDRIISLKNANSVYFLALLFLYFSYSVYLPRGTLLYPSSKFFIVAAIIFVGQIRFTNTKPLSS